MDTNSLSVVLDFGRDLVMLDSTGTAMVPRSLANRSPSLPAIAKMRFTNGGGLAKICLGSDLKILVPKVRMNLHVKFDDMKLNETIVCYFNQIQNVWFLERGWAPRTCRCSC
jgi:hypothetical protein